MSKMTKPCHTIWQCLSLSPTPLPSTGPTVGWLEMYSWYPVLPTPQPGRQAREGQNSSTEKVTMQRETMSRRGGWAGARLTLTQTQFRGMEDPQPCILYLWLIFSTHSKFYYYKSSQIYYFKHSQKLSGTCNLFLSTPTVFHKAQVIRFNKSVVCEVKIINKKNIYIYFFKKFLMCSTTLPSFRGDCQNKAISAWISSCLPLWLSDFVLDFIKETVFFAIYSSNQLSCIYFSRQDSSWKQGN